MSMEMADAGVDFVIIVALKEELAEFLRHVNEPYESEPDPETQNIYYRFELQSTSSTRRCVALMIGDMGPTHAAITIGAALARYRPGTVIMLGIAGSLDDEARIGDVVMATSVDGYLESSKITDDDVPIQFSGEVFKCNPRLVARIRNLEFTNVASYRRWQADCESFATVLLSEIEDPGTRPDGFRPQVPRLLDGPVASGPFVVASVAFRKLLRARNRKYRALEMESTGVIAACEHQAVSPALVVLRGISDRADPSKAQLDEVGEGFYRRLAMGSASLLLLMLIREDLLEWPDAAMGPAGAPPPANTVPSSNPQPATAVWEDTFIGRESELETMRNHFANPGERRIFTIAGEGGIGKTRLAAEFAAANSALFPDGVFYVDLGSTFEIDGVLAAIERVLGLGAAAPEPERLKRLTVALRHKRMLLVLDNFESVVDSAPLVQEICYATDQLSVLVTSREGLKVRNERVMRLGPLPCPDIRDDPSSFGQSEAIRLFMARAEEATGQDKLERRLEPIAQLCRQLGGIPLGIELAARQTAYVDPAELLSQLQRHDEAERLLTDSRRGTMKRHQSLFGVFESSIALLDQHQVELLEDISVFSGGASLEAIKAVYGDSGSDLVKNLATLIDKSLVRTDRTVPDQTRYTMLAPIKEHARSRQEDGGRSQRADEAHARYFAQLARQAEPELLGPNQVSWLDRLEPDVWNFHQAHRWLVANGDVAESMQLVAGLSRFWFTRDYLSTGRELVETAVEITPDIPGEVLASWRICRALIAWYAGNYALADSLFEQVIAFGSEHHAPWFEANALANRGLVAQSEDRLADALALYSAGEAVARAAGDDWNLAVCRVGIARALHDEGELEAAAKIYAEGLTLFRRVGDIWSLGRILRRMLVLAVDTGNDALINEILPEARENCAILRDVHGSAQLYAILASLEEKRNRLTEALRLYLSSAMQFEPIGVPKQTTETLNRSVVLLIRKAEIRLAGQLAGLTQQLRPGGAIMSPEDYLSALDIQLEEPDARVFHAEFARGMNANAHLLLSEAMRIAGPPAED
jgi:predicted ATPase/nucleoside phosphorylase